MEARKQGMGTLAVMADIISKVGDVRIPHEQRKWPTLMVNSVREDWVTLKRTYSVIMSGYKKF